MKDFLANLNKEQYEAATTLDGAVLIVAGAGTGKTHTLVSRVANMLDEGILASEILLLTCIKILNTLLFPLLLFLDI